ncbi:MAG TPA: hypothetical protein VIK91_12980 [Nannocystis sp.]
MDDSGTRHPDRRINLSSHHPDWFGLGGISFDSTNAAKYAPLEQSQLDDVLYDFRLKNKSSRLMQFADLYLYPMCRGGYPRPYTPYHTLRTNGQLIDTHVGDASVEGIKYYCFERVRQLDMEKVHKEHGDRE